MNMNERMATLSNNGINTSKYFTLVVNNDIPAGSKIQIEIDEPEMCKQIEMDGYVKNSKIHRRFICAQYMRMMNSREGWNAYFRKYYGYMYQFDMLINECKALYHIQNKDWQVYRERSRFFTVEKIHEIVETYLHDVEEYISKLPRFKLHGAEHVTINGYGYIPVDQIESCVLSKLRVFASAVTKSWNYKKLYDSLSFFRKQMVELPYEYRKIPAFRDCFQLSGAYYTLRNLIMFHDVKLVYDSNKIYNTKTALDILYTVGESYRGYQMHAMLKKTIAENDFDFQRSVLAHQK